ncbi:hypothetical protein [Nocardia sp. NPDC051750]|uniref:hypothetical protein n=1 Tax=Nocardia sp. NPDC051750 TaxID=3364325 RepID=UPI0037AE88F0
MNTRGSTPDRRVGRLAWNQKTSAGAGLVVVLMLGIAVLSGCGSGDDAETGSAPAVSTPRQLEAVPAPDPATPDGVAVAALREIYHWEPAAEVPGASLERARRFLGPSLVRVLGASTETAGAPGVSLRWGEWAAAGARVEAFTFASGDRPPAGPDPAVRQYKIGIEQTVVYPDGREEPLAPATVIATVVRTPEGWRLDGYR